MITDLTLPRVDLAFGRNEPVQWSENLQLALNSYSELLIVEPRFPSYHHAITKTRNQTTLNAKEIFRIGLGLHTESISKLPLGKFVNVVFKDGDEFYSGLVNDPAVVLHQWTLNFKSTRDCWLGVLFNTSELLVLGRENYKKSYNYRVKINVFETLVQLYDIPYYDGKWWVSAEECRHLRVKFFTFNTINDVLYLALVDLANRVSIFKWETNKLHLVSSHDFAKSILRVYWKENIFLVVGLDNSVTVLSNELDHSSQVSPSQSAQNQKNEIVLHQGKHYIVCVFTSKVVIFDEDESFEFDTHSWCACSSLNVGVLENKLNLLLSFEDGKFLRLDFDLETKCFQTRDNGQSLDLFVARALYNFEVNTNGEENEVGEGSLIIQGATSISDNILAVVSKVIPKRGLHLRIPSENSVQLSFVRLEKPVKRFNDEISNTTSLAKLAKLYLESYMEFPAIVDAIATTHYDKVNAFYTEIGLFTDKMLASDEKKLTYSGGSNGGGGLAQVLKSHFLENAKVKDLQFKHTLARLLSNAIETHITSNNKAAKMLLESVSVTRDLIESKIKHYLTSLVLDACASQSGEFDAYDTFVLLSMQKLHSWDKNSSDTTLPDKVSITVKGGRTITETFEIASRSSSSPQFQPQPQAESSKRMVFSVSKHGWATCDLTNLPILTMHNQVDELNQFRYFSVSEVDSKIVKTLLNTLGYCYISGNRRYDIR
ncbi:uncharacterized protein LODBEIA_P44820 [Lodderomyces beijingensis]|uniref:Transcription factor IIIC 90kDa subunit N-terminal domain-containing protein n=1 Tax=Lodderomyces beijingensis TaxID=1775926 RepID=A0ABP0ZQ15_9ASCO